MLLPLRRFAYATEVDATWSQEGYIASWLMKLSQTDGIALLILERSTDSDGADASDAGATRAVESTLLLPQMDPWLTRHQRRFVAFRPAAMQQYVSHRARAVANMTEGASTVRARVVSCFTHNERPPQPLYQWHVNLLDRHLAFELSTSCVGTRSAIGDWLVPLRPLAEQRSLPPECAELLRAPGEVLRAAEAGFARLRKPRRAPGGEAAQADAGPLGVEQPPGADHGSSNTRGIDAEATAWYWHELALVHAAARAHGVLTPWSAWAAEQDREAKRSRSTSVSSA